VYCALLVAKSYS